MNRRGIKVEAGKTYCWSGMQPKKVVFFNSLGDEIGHQSLDDSGNFKAPPEAAAVSFEDMSIPKFGGLAVEDKWVRDRREAGRYYSQLKNGARKRR